MLSWENGFALLYKVSQKELVLAIPEQGIGIGNRLPLSTPGVRKAKSSYCNRTKTRPSKNLD